jgi:hypothetical protein
MGVLLDQATSSDDREFSYEEQIQRIVMRRSERIMLGYVQKVLDAHLRIDVEPLALNKWCQAMKRQYPNRTPIEVVDALEKKEPLKIDPQFKAMIDKVVKEGVCGAFLDFDEGL